MIVLGVILTLAASGPVRPPARPNVDLEVAGKNLILIRSLDPLERVDLPDLPEWSDYYVRYQPDGHSALVSLRTKEGRLRIVIETSRVRDLGLQHRHEFSIRNPDRR